MKRIIFAVIAVTLFAAAASAHPLRCTTWCTSGPMPICYTNCY